MQRSKGWLVWSAEAEDDLLSIWRFGSNEWSATVADDHQRLLWRSCERLLKNPELGKPRGEISTGLHSIFVDPHVVFYRISPDAIEIVRVLHHSEDVETVFH
jgi:toxin ParE1/3/4